jgi:predicted DNA repair protein MutK
MAAFLPLAMELSLLTPQVLAPLLDGRVFSEFQQIQKISRVIHHSVHHASGLKHPHAYR